MGMYTELALNLNLCAKKTPPEMVRFFTAVSNVEDLVVPPQWGTMPKYHPTDGTDGWPLTSGGSYYFGGNCLFKFSEYDTTGEFYRFTLWTNIKNYVSQWEWLIDLLGPWVDDGHDDETVGTYRYEEDDFPMLVVKRGDKLVLTPVNIREKAST